MKTSSSPLGLLVFVLFLFCACSKQAENQYSCDPQLNDWVAKNHARLGNISREELVHLGSIDSQLCLYRGLPPSAQCNIWKEKLQLVIETYGYPDAEKQHIQAAYDYLDPEKFENDNVSGLDQWTSQWAQQGMVKFGWDSAKIWSIAETWLSNTDIAEINAHYTPSDQTEEPSGLPNPPPVEVKNCNCRSSWGCGWVNEHCDYKTECSIKKGCGLWGNSDCKARCSGSAMSDTRA